MKKSGILTVAIVLLLILVSGCGGTKIKTSEGTVTQKGNTVELKDTQGNTAVVGSGATLPEGYPKEVVPIYNGAVIDVSGKTGDNNSPVYSVSYHVNTGYKEVFTYYAGIMKDAKELNKVETGDFNAVTGIKQDMQIIIHISKYNNDEKQTQVIITIEKGGKP